MDVDSVQTIPPEYVTLDRIFSNINVAIAYLDCEFKYIHVNRAYEANSLLPAAELIGKNHFDLFPDDTLQRIFLQVVETGQPYKPPEHHSHFPANPGNQLSSWNWNVVPTFDQDRNVNGLILAAIDVTEQHQANQALQESQAMFRSLFESAPDANILVDQEGKIQAVNQQVEIMFGYKREEVLGKPVEMLIPPNLRSRHIQERIGYLHHPIIRPMGTGLDLYLLTKQGDEIPVDITLSPLKTKQGVLTICVVRDLSQRMKAERALQKQANTIRLLRDVAVAANEATDIEATMEFTIHRVCDHTGWQVGHALIRDDATTLIPTQVWHVTDPVRFAPFIRVTKNMTFPPGIDLPGETLITGKPIWIQDLHTDSRFTRTREAAKAGLKSAVIFPVLARTEVVAALEFFSDKTLPPDPGSLEILSQVGAQLGRVIERTHSEEALEKSETRFRTIFSKSGVGIKLLDLNGFLLASNPAFQGMLGFSAEELNGKHYSDITLPEDRDANIAEFRALSRGEVDSFQFEKRYVRKDNQIMWGKQVFSLVRGANHEPEFIIGMVEDITRRKQMEAELIEMQHRLLESTEAERLHLAQDLHDGPIQDLYGASFQLQDLEDNAVNRSAQTEIAESRTAIQQVISTLRMICGELRPPSLAPFGLEKAIRSHAEHFHEIHPEIEIILDLESDQKLLSERIRLTLFRIYQQILSNVVRHAQASRLEIRLRLTKDEVILEGKDNGCGFELPNRLIELARQGHFGIVGSFERAEALGGRLEIESAPSKGATIRAIIPRGES